MCIIWLDLYSVLYQLIVIVPQSSAQGDVSGELYALATL